VAMINPRAARYGSLWWINRLPDPIEMRDEDKTNLGARFFFLMLGRTGLSTGLSFCGLPRPGGGGPPPLDTAAAYMLDQSVEALDVSFYSPPK
jgi:hypothetical protein